MNYPDCPENRTDCRFEHLGGSATLMYSPIAYDREGNAVAGGWNVVTKGVRCLNCARCWTSEQTQLEEAQGKPRKWRPER